MGQRPGEGSGAGEEPVPDPGPSGGAAPDPDPGLAGFVKDGVWDSTAPSAALAAALEGAAGPGWRCEGGSRAGIIGAVRAAAALESWWCAAKLGLIRAAIRQDDDGLGRDYHGDLPDGWSRSLAADVGLALAMSPVSAEAMIAPRVAGKTYGQVESIAARAAITVDPDLAGRAREHAERNRARVILKRERSGVYQDSGAFPGVLADQFRAMAYLDLMNEISAGARIAAGPPDVGLGAPA